MPCHQHAASAGRFRERDRVIRKEREIEKARERWEEIQRDSQIERKRIEREITRDRRSTITSERKRGEQRKREKSSEGRAEMREGLSSFN